MINVALTRTLIAGAFAACFAVNASAANSFRLVQSLDDNWRFQLGITPEAVAPGYDDSTWRVVDVPHDYAVEGVVQRTNPFPDATIGRDGSWYTMHGFLPVQSAMYRKALAIPAEAKGRRLSLEFDGVFSNSRYWINGAKWAANTAATHGRVSTSRMRRFAAAQTF